MTFIELQNGLYQSMEHDIFRRVSNILYRNLIIVFGDLIQFDIMSIIDEAMRKPKIELYVEFKNVKEDGIQHDSNIEDDRVEVDSEEIFEATYETDDEDENGAVGGVADPEDGEFRIKIEYSSRRSIVAAIRSYTISRGVDYNIYEFESQTFYAKCKTYGCGCDWLIQAHVHHWNDFTGSFQVGLGHVVEVIRPLIEIGLSIKVKFIIAKVQSRFIYNINY
ncbi:hypothetical protein Ahy_A09g046706 [Arachis hypogaea]|uniref:Uncharacterized protein n=1 Tax=Arachis hypogaea TaxID=3818 RepID=A0A445BQK0_ARAHY|nr:hypothetical protein Ahy_A09g046706 [Arachis hypogaea]